MLPPYMHFRKVLRGAFGVAFGVGSRLLKKHDKRDIGDKPDMVQVGSEGGQQKIKI